MYRFYSNPSETNVRVTVVGMLANGILKLASARCSSKDNFVRKKGRAIAEHRLNNGACSNVFLINDEKNFKIKDFVGFARIEAQRIARHPELTISKNLKDLEIEKINH